jgi:hypothetical protein
METNFKDYMIIIECYEILKSYKRSEVGEMECLISLINKFEELKAR